MFRLYFNIFWNKDREYHHQPHEAPATMTIPLIVLAFGSVFAGYLPFSHLVTSDRLPFETHLHWNIAGASVGIGLLGIIVAMLLYRRESAVPERLSLALGGFYKTVYNKFYIDELYLFVTKKIIFNMISRPIAWFDRHVVDGTMNGIGWITEKTSFKIRGLQTGQVQQYGFVFALSSVGLVLLFLWFVIK